MKIGELILAELDRIIERHPDEKMKDGFKRTREFLASGVVEEGNILFPAIMHIAASYIAFAGDEALMKFLLEVNHVPQPQEEAAA